MNADIAGSIVGAAGGYFGGVATGEIGGGYWEGVSYGDVFGAWEGEGYGTANGSWDGQCWGDIHGYWEGKVSGSISPASFADQGIRSTSRINSDELGENEISLLASYYADLNAYGTWNGYVNLATYGSWSGDGSTTAQGYWGGFAILAPHGSWTASYATLYAVGAWDGEADLYFEEAILSGYVCLQSYGSWGGSLGFSTNGSFDISSLSGSLPGGDIYATLDLTDVNSTINIDMPTLYGYSLFYLPTIYGSLTQPPACATVGGIQAQGNATIPAIPLFALINA
ncbi:MAG: hypothetical protein LBS59_08270 [Puniceicoccales bacterium]|jgi:hypothetical protein|nr:hypothetical protein [Puniceicoccales bacterium]